MRSKFGSKQREAKLTNCGTVLEAGRAARYSEIYSVITDKIILELSLAYMSCSPGQKPFDLSILRQAQDTASSRHHGLRDLPVPQFVELVETNPGVTSAFAS